MMKIIKQISISIFLIFLIPTILVAIWFKDGHILGTAESGLPFYNLNLQFNINDTAWAKYTLGHPINIGVAAKPTYWFLAMLQNVGIPGFLLQASFLWLSFIISGFSIYFLSKELFSGLDKKIYLLAALFYWFNPFSLVNIWNRFLNNFIVFYMFLPLALLLFIKGLKTKRYIYAIFIGLASLVFSYALSSIAFDLVLWFILIYTAIFYLLFGKQNRVFLFKFFALTFLFWNLVNLWWIAQVFSYIGLGSFSLVTSNSFISNDNYRTFYMLSSGLGNLTDLLRLKHAAFFANIENIKWVIVYKFFIIAFLEFLVTTIFLLPIIIRRRQLEVLLLGGLLLLSAFFAKGNNPPLGEIFDKVFINVSFLQVFRNPFEKIGFILSLAAAPLFSLGVSILIQKLKSKWGKIVYFSLFFWLLIVWGGPFWTSYVFTSTESPTNKPDIGYQVDVPKDYREASSWLLSESNDFRLIIFPMGGEGITYTWPKGYSGVELSNQLLPVTSVSFNTNIPFYNDISKSLERIFLTRDNFVKIMDLINSKFIVFRTDIDWKMREMRNPQVIQNKLEIEQSNKKLSRIKEFGNLQFWEYLGWQDHHIYPAKNLIKVSGMYPIEDILNGGLEEADALYGGTDKINEEQLIKSELIHPIRQFSLGKKETNTDFKVAEEIIFPAVRVLPSDTLYPFILLKEQIELALISDNNSIILKQISLLGKRLVETQKEGEKGNINAAEKILSNYLNQFKKVIILLADISKIKSGDHLVSQEEAYKVFLKHLGAIEKLKQYFPKDKVGEISKVEEDLKTSLVENGILPKFTYLQRSDFPLDRRVVYRFSVDEPGRYELLLDSKNWGKYFKLSLTEPMQFQIDQNIVRTTGGLDNSGLISYGFFDFSQGIHEISWNVPEEINLVNTPQEINFSVEHGVTDKPFKINNFDPYSVYLLSLNYQIKKGSGMEVRFEQNNNKLKNGEIVPGYFQILNPDMYDFDFKNFSTYLHPSQSADNAVLNLRVRPWNNCANIYWYQGEGKWVTCAKEETRRPYDRTSDVVVKDVSIVKVMTESPILRRVGGSGKGTAVPKINVHKINQAEYRVDVMDAKGPFAIILSELFDQGWQISRSDGKAIDKEHFLANSYANGWIIDNDGSFQMIIKFKPQEILQKGEIVSLVAALGGIILMGWQYWRRYGK